jgi:amidase
MRWKEAVTAKQSDIWADVPNGWRVEDLASRRDVLDVRALIDTLSRPVEQRIARHSGVELLEILKQGEGSAQEVMRALAHRAILAHQLVRTRLTVADTT